jgi:hypothetical protein
MSTSHLFQKTAAHLLLALASWSWFAPSAPAQEGLENLLATLGTTTQDPSGRTWAYLIWDATSPQMLLGQTFAVYAKPGPASSSTPYSRTAILTQQTDPRVIEPLLQRGVNLGDDLSNLSTELDSLFGPLLPVSTLPVADKLSAVIRGSIGNEEFLRDLLLLARLHAGVALACGVAHAQVLTNYTMTFEVRAFDSARDRDLGVLGRVTLLDAADRLPAPGPPVEVVDANPKGHLNVKLRWATSDPLRREGMRQQGYNVWRVTKAYAEANGWHLAPPLLLSVTPNVVLRRNVRPILTSRDFTEAEVGNFTPLAGDSTTVFFADDDGRFNPGYDPTVTGFTNGAQFYYFVTARDLLGRDGKFSPGTRITVCDRMPPLPPDGLRVVNDYAFTSADPQHLRVTWNQITNTAEGITYYWVYRWQTVEEIFPASRDASNHLIGIVAHANGLAKNSYLDDGVGSPSAPSSYGKTFWYTVRAQDSGACGPSPNLSANSGPAFGVLRDREGPGGATGCVSIAQITPTVRFVSENWSNQSGVFGQFAFKLNCIRTNPEIAYAAFTVRIQEQSNLLQTITSGPIYFPRESSIVSFDFLCSETNAWLHAMATIEAVVATADNRLSAPEEHSLDLWFIATKFGKKPPILNFEGGIAVSRGCLPGKHNPGASGYPTNEPVSVIFEAPPDSREYRVYRRVDGGEPMLLCQGTNQPGVNTCKDDSLPRNAAEICYFVQLLDQHGNTSPMTELGCITLQPTHESLPIPKLSPITATNQLRNPGMVLRWFCPNAGVERFHVGIAGPLGSPIAPELAAATNLDGKVPTLTGLSDFFLRVYATPRLGTAFTNGPLFTAIITNIQDGAYKVFVRAVAKDGTSGYWSEHEEHVVRTQAPALPPEVMWPWRPWPATASSDTVSATNLNATNVDFHGGAVLIGQKEFSSVYENVTRGNDTNTGPQYILGTDADPTNFLFSVNGKSLFPLAMYRCQVTNANFPRVSGDIIQVSPLMENIAYSVATSGGDVVTNTLWDPFILYDMHEVEKTYWKLKIYMLDTQPVLRGARYRYLLVHFGPDWEMEYILPTNEMEVPL